MVIDAMVYNEGNGWAGSGANPWHLDNQTESILFLTDMGEQPARIGFKVWAGGQVYYLGKLRLVPRETRAIDLRKLRDAQKADRHGHTIPAGAGDGSVLWIRLDNVPVMGRLAVISRQGGVASSYDCSQCACPANYSHTTIGTQCPVAVNGTDQLDAQEWFQVQCSSSQYYQDVTEDPYWSSSDNTIFTVNNTSPIGLLKALQGGTATAGFAQTSQECATWAYEPPGSCQCTSYTTAAAGAACPIDGATISGPVQTVDGSTTPSFSVTARGDTPTSYAWSFQAPSGAGDNPNVSFTPGNQASTTTNAHWFALPNDTCNASSSAAYTIIATVTFPGSLQLQPQTTLTVNLFATAGYENEAFVSGLPSMGQNQQGTWIVTGAGSLARNVATPVVVYATSSQFYNKVYAHEQEHYSQWTTGMNSDLYVVSNLYSLVSPLTAGTQADLLNQVQSTMSNWTSGQHSTYVSRLSAVEADAYRISDPIAPQYVYQSSCGGHGL